MPKLQHTCKECGKPFTARTSAIYCSPACRSKVYYRNNREKCIQLTKNWEARNPDKVKDRKKRYRDKQKEK